MYHPSIAKMQNIEEGKSYVLVCLRPRIGYRIAHFRNFKPQSWVAVKKEANLVSKLHISSFQLTIFVNLATKRKVISRLVIGL
jgi:hypothetical protein